MHGYNLEKSAIRHSQSQRTKGKGGEKKTAQVLVGEALLTWLLCLVSSLPLGRLCHVRGGRQEPKATGSPY